MHKKLLQIFLVFVSISNLLRTSSAQEDTSVNTNVESNLCLNPNIHLGHCISIYDCISLRYVVEHRLRPLYSFVRASECPNGKGRTPFVCCTSDIRFQQELTFRSRNERIIFPDEINRNKITKLKLLNETSTTTTSTTEGSIEQKLLNSTENIINSDPSTEPFQKFPKPPNCGGFTLSNKIYGGTAAELGEFSWMVILEYRNLTSGELLMDCSGSIINERYILTAAHCVQGEILKMNGKLESVRVGEYNTDTEADCDERSCRPPFQRLRIESVISHKNYNSKNNLGARNEHDIALLRLEKPLKFDEDLQPVCLPDVEDLQTLDDDTKFTVSGWGHNGLRTRTVIKQKVELPYIKNDKCREIFAKKFFLTDKQLCAGGQFRKDSCNGDSGGPLMRLSKEFWVLEGIVSFGLDCGLERPGIYTNVRQYLNWIDDHVKSV